MDVREQRRAGVFRRKRVSAPWTVTADGGRRGEGEERSRTALATSGQKHRAGGLRTHALKEDKKTAIDLERS